MAHPRIVILGGGFAGVNTAQALSRHLPQTADIVLISSRFAHTFSPWLYEVASGNAVAHAHGVNRALAMSADVPLAALLPSGGRVRFRHAVVSGLDLEHKHVILEGGHTVQYDVLVIGLGSEVAYFGIPGLEDCSLPLKTTQDAVAIHRRVGELVESVMRGDRSTIDIRIGGAGPSGVELAAELATMFRTVTRQKKLPSGALRVTMFDAGSRVLGMMLAKVSQATERRLHSLGVEVMSDTMLAECYPNAVLVRPRPRGDGEDSPSRSPFTGATRLSSDLTIWTGGVKPNSVLDKFDLPKDPRGRIRVTPSFEVYGHPNIFALGDAAIFVNPATNQPVPQTAQAAEFAATRVANNIVRALDNRPLIPVQLPKSWPFVVAVGGRYGVAAVGNIVIKGYLAYLIRRAADGQYFFRTLPFGLALRTWWRGVALYGTNDG